MKLLNKEIIKNLPPLYSTEHIKDPLVMCKFFTPDSSWSWYVIEFDEVNQIFYGYICGFENELGYFSLEEIESIKGPLGLDVERDISFTPKKLSVVKKEFQ
ncbi:DUF2958 domain-containing protein [Aliarcobacter cryaerophilus]|uniref:DUF2958 domain-containing protein n=1 Tax=Aliarcobacter cryaerophilus TaxID=28198 RepID=UPI0021B1AFCE|nr:DUF2958 domain-containing protein [Aliarcobacter cryaerophilus]MCT7405239.1 DUF2958 domain-containing protein [Aliarcobacter cryaerophilus]MCT7431756.1 DUF2958 domain-containing protein [Aliarcobacter cryaerophilus]MCT7502720.1 DUF2958 domain-containing protein [Aliarcobacter cryaerophilus]